MCHWPARRQGRTLELHHIVGGAGRKNLPDGSNFIALCQLCHKGVHDRVANAPEIPKGAVLTAKMLEDGEIDLFALAQLKHKQHLGYDPEPIPDYYLEQRHKQGGDTAWP